MDRSRQPNSISSWEHVSIESRPYPEYQSPSVVRLSGARNTRPPEEFTDSHANLIKAEHAMSMYRGSSSADYDHACGLISTLSIDRHSLAVPLTYGMHAYIGGHDMLLTPTPPVWLLLHMSRLASAVDRSWTMTGHFFIRVNGLDFGWYLLIDRAALMRGG